MKYPTLRLYSEKLAVFPFEGKGRDGSMENFLQWMVPRLGSKYTNITDLDEFNEFVDAYPTTTIGLFEEVIIIIKKMKRRGVRK